MSLVAMTAAAVTATASVVSSATTAGAVATDTTASVATSLPGIVAHIAPSAVTTMPVTVTSLQIPASLELTAAFTGALAGALAGVRLRFDLVGIATLAVVSGLGGGIIRDVLLQYHGIYAFQNPTMLVATLVAAMVGFFFYSLAAKLKTVLFLVDAVALGLFAVLGADKALLAGLTVLPVILLGSITAVGGGMLRDLFTNNIPQVLRPGSYYATVAVAGSALYVLCADYLNLVKPLAMGLSVVAVIGLRLITYFFDLKTPMATDLTPMVVAAPRKVVAAGGKAIELIAPSARVGARSAGEGPDEREQPNTPEEDDHDPRDRTH